MSQSARASSDTMPQVTDAVVIALDDSSRLDGFRACPGTRMFRVLTASDARRGEGGAEFDDATCRRLFGFDALAAEKAIAHSHHRALRDFALAPGRPQDVLVVAEDDARPIDDVVPVLRRIVERGLVRGVVVLAHGRSEPGRIRISGIAERQVQLSALSAVVGRTGRHLYRVGHYSGVLWGAGLYAVTREAAQRHLDLVRRSRGIHWMADDWGYFSRAAGIDVRLLRPNLAGWAGHSTFRDEVPTTSEGTAGSLRDEIARTVALRTRLRLARNVSAITLRDLADHLEQHGHIR